MNRALMLLVMLVPGLALARPVSVTIAASGTTSGEFQVPSGECVVGVHMDSDWTAGTMGFTCAEKSGGDFQTVKDSGGTAHTLTVASDDYIDLTLDGSSLCGCDYGKVTSSVSQTNAQSIVLILAR